MDQLGAARHRFCGWVCDVDRHSGRVKITLEIGGNQAKLWLNKEQIEIDTGKELIVGGEVICDCQLKFFSLEPSTLPGTAPPPSPPILAARDTVWTI